MDPNQPTDQSQNPMGTPATDSGMGQPVGAGTPQQTPTPQEPTVPATPAEPVVSTPEPSMPPVPQTPAPEEGGQTGEDTGVGSGTPPVTPAA